MFLGTPHNITDTPSFREQCAMIVQLRVGLNSKTITRVTNEAAVLSEVVRLFNEIHLRVEILSVYEGAESKLKSTQYSFQRSRNEIVCGTEIQWSNVNSLCSSLLIKDWLRLALLTSSCSRCRTPTRSWSHLWTTEEGGMTRLTRGCTGLCVYAMS